MRCREESCALKTEGDAKEAKSLVAARLSVGGEHVFLQAARRCLCCPYAYIGGRQASLIKMGIGVEKKSFVTSRHTWC